MLKFFRRLKFLVISIAIVFLVATISSFANLSLFSKKTNDTSAPKTTEVNDEPQDEDDDKDTDTNILFFGDTTDAMVVASIDNKNKDVKLNSLDNKDYSEITDKDTLLSTIEKDNNINLDKFIQIDFKDLINIVSVLGEVTVDVKEDEINLINNLIPKYYAESNYGKGTEMKLLESSGEQKLNTYQTMAYASLIADNPDKQKEVLVSVMDKMKNKSLSMYADIYKTIKPYINTNITIGDVISLASSTYINK